MSTTIDRRQPDWSTKLGRPAPVYFALAILATGAVGSEFLHLPVMYAVIGGSAMMLMVGLTLTLTGRYKSYEIKWAGFCALCASGWCAWAFGVGAWTQPVLSTWFVGSIFLGGLSQLLIPARDVPTSGGRHVTASPAGGELVLAGQSEIVLTPEEQVLAIEQRERLAIVRQWQERVVRICGKDVVLEFVSMTEWPEGTGYSIRWMLPLGGTTRRAIEAKTEELAVDAALPDACGVEILPTGNRRMIDMQVSTEDVLAEERTYFDLFPDLLRTSINQTITAGWMRDGSLAQGDLRSDAWVVVGTRGSGKSNLLHTLMAGLARCDDVLVFVIDLGKNGDLGMPWIAPWVRGDAERPIVDWLATTPDEALIMTEFVIEVLDARARGYQSLLAQRATDKLPVCPQYPKILILMDEAAEVTGEASQLKKVTENVLRINRTGRQFACDALLGTLRSTSDTIPVSYMRQTRVRAVMRTEDESEIQNALGWNRRIDPADAPYEGCGFWRAGSSPVRPFRTPHMQRHDIDAIAIHCANYRPDLDDISVDVKLGTAYRNRWQRVIPHHYGDISVKGYGPHCEDVVPGRRPAAQVDTAGGHRGGHAEPAEVDNQVDTPAPMSTSGVHSEPADDPELAALLAAGHRPASTATQAFMASLAGFQQAISGVREEAPQPAGEHLASVTELHPAAESDPAIRRVLRGDGRDRMVEILYERHGQPIAGTDLIEALRREGYETPEKTIYGWLGRDPVRKPTSAGYVHMRYAS